MDWLETAIEFERAACGKLSPGQALELEGEVFPPLLLPSKALVTLIELPGVYRVVDGYQGYSAFRFFMDGAQRTFLWRYHTHRGLKIPVYLHFSGAVVMKREKPWKFVPIAEKFRTNIILPDFLHEEYSGLKGVVSSGAENPRDMSEIKSRAEITSRALRQELEVELCREFCKSKNELLLKDGSIADVPFKNVVGVIKSHRALYLERDYPGLQLRIWNMPKYYRSSAFSIKLPSGIRINSFYLRLHEPLEPEHGLVRVEFTTQDRQAIAEWLIAESLIVSRGERWDTQLFCIEKCEDYIKARLPSRRMINAIAVVP